MSNDVRRITTTSSQSTSPPEKETNLPISTRSALVERLINALWGVVGCVGGWGIAVVQQWTDVNGILLVSSVFCAVVAMTFMYVALRHSQAFFDKWAALQEKNREAAQELQGARTEFTQLQNEHAELRTKIYSTPEAFRRLSEKVRAFEAQSVGFYNSVIKDLIRSSASADRSLVNTNLADSKANLTEAHDDALRLICDVGIKAIGDRPGGSSHLFSINLKLLKTDKNDDAGEASYSSIHRAGPYGYERANHDKTKNNKILVKENLMYEELLRRPRDPDRHLLIQDLDAYLDQKGNEGLLSSFKEPTRETAKYLKSCLLVPITKLANSTQLMGTLCIDSPSKNAFDIKYDLSILKELANYAAAVMGSYEMTREVLQLLDPGSWAKGLVDSGGIAAPASKPVKPTDGP